MIMNNNMPDDALPLYEVKELSMEEALLVLAADKEVLQQRMRRATLVPTQRLSWLASGIAGSAAA